MQRKFVQDKESLVGVLKTRQTMHRQLEAAQKARHQLESQCRQTQCLSSVGMAWAITAHEINNLLTPMTSYAQLALQYPDDSELTRKSLEKTVFLGQRAGIILEKVMAMASGKSLEKSRIEMDALLDDVFLCIGRDFAKDGIRVERRCAAGTTVRADRILLGQAVMNLALNARRAMLDKGGTLSIAAESTDTGTQITIADTGCGMTAHVCSRIFDPFFTSANNLDEQTGNGLGLAFCRQIVEVHDGGIQVESEPGQGTTFRIFLPSH